MRRTLSGTRAIVTGASEGIGRALALELARCGVRLMLVARRENLLTQLQTEIQRAGGEARFVAGDITDSTLRQAAVDSSVAAWGGLDLLINNAGVGDLARFEDQTTDDLRRVMDVNFFSAVELLRAALPHLRQGTKPMVVNVASILAHRATPRNSAYCASKFALRGFSEAVRPELARLGIDVLVVSPGATETRFHENVVVQRTQPAYRLRHRTSAEYVARKTVAAIRSGRHEVIPSKSGQLLVWLNRLTPRLVDRLLHSRG